MKTLFKSLKLFSSAIFFIFIFYSQHTDAQILDKLIKKSTKSAEDAVIKKTSDKVEKETNKAMDSILNPTEKKKQKKDDSQEDDNENTNKEVLESEGDENNEANTSSNDKNEGLANDSANEKLVLWSNYNFVPGEKIIFQDDLTGEESGEFPSRWDLLKGSAENASLGEDKVIHIDNKGVVTPLMEESEYLPEVFTIEFDAYFNEVLKANYYQNYILRLWAGTGSHHENGNVYDPIKIFRHEVRFRTIKNNSVNEFRGDDEHLDDKNPSWRHIAIAFNKRTIKLFIDQYRVLNVPNLGFKPSMFSIGGISSQSNEDVIAIKNIRIAEGGKKLYDRVLSDGKYVTSGILFDINKAIIKPESMGVINEIARMMKDHPDLRFSIEGHTDSDGSDTSNQKLSKLRAASVKNTLVSLGIDSLRMEIKGLGESVPVSDNTTAEGKANNRRVEFIKI